MGLFIAALIGGFISIIGSLVGRVLIALALSFVTFTGIDVGFGVLKDHVINSMTGMPADLASFLAFLWLDKAVSLVLSAYTAALALKMAGSTTITKLVRK